MTEIYHGPWSPVRGDVSKEKVQDIYHRYPTNKQVEVVNDEPGTVSCRISTTSPAGNDS